MLIDLKNSLLIPEKFLDAKKLRTLQGANQNSSLCSSDNDLLGSRVGATFHGRPIAVLVFWLKFLKLFANYFPNITVGAQLIERDENEFGKSNPYTR